MQSQDYYVITVFLIVTSSPAVLQGRPLAGHMEVAPHWNLLGTSRVPLWTMSRKNRRSMVRDLTSAGEGCVQVLEAGDTSR